METSTVRNKISTCHRENLDIKNIKTVDNKISTCQHEKLDRS